MPPRHPSPAPSSIRRRRSLGALLASILLTGCAARDGAQAGPAPVPEPGTPVRTAPGGTWTLVDDLPVLELAGDAAARGTAQGRLAGPAAKRLLGLMSWAPGHRHGRGDRWLLDTLAAIRPQDRAEITALAEAAGVPPQALLEANALVDTQCSAIVSLSTATAPLVAARNMDFFPAGALGAGTMLGLVRGAGPHAYATVGWPGSIGVVSGMNDAGLVACVLLNHGGPELPGAEPLTLRLRRILAESPDVADAVRRFAAAPVASSHYVLLADPDTACVVWQGRDGLHRDDADGGWLCASNGIRQAGQPADARGRRLRRRAAEPDARPGDTDWMAQSLTATCMLGINAQAMVFIPAERRLQLARGDLWHAAALASRLDLELGPVLDGTAPLADLKPVRRPAPAPIPHYWAFWLGRGTRTSG